MIKVGYLKKDGQEIIAEQFVGAPDANHCMEQLIANHANKDNIEYYFFELVTENGLHRYGYIDP